MTILLCQPLPPLIGKSPAIEALRSVAGRVADTDLPILIRGRNGRRSRDPRPDGPLLSRRAEGPFVRVRAEADRVGRAASPTKMAKSFFAQTSSAAGGTLFLDEIGELDLAAQADLLPVLDEQATLRLLASTSQDLAELARQQRFCADLLFRLGVVTLDLPPLAQRGDDILLFGRAFPGRLLQASPLRAAGIFRRGPGGRSSITLGRAMWRN